MGSMFARLSSRLATPGLIDRPTGKQVMEPCPFFDALRLTLLYQTWFGQLLLSLPLTWWFLSWQHHRVARYADSHESRKSIKPFIKTYDIDTSAAEKPVEAYATLQAFFTRRLKPGLRPLAAPDNDAVAVQPADSRCVVYDSIDAAHRFWIKGQHFSIAKLMGPGYDTTDHWQHAAVAINRLSPSDIHRLHASVSGRVVRVARRGTRFMASEFAAVHSRMDIMVDNDRIVMEFDSKEFGTVVQVMIGASEVGSVMPLVKEGQHVKKGDEVAVFAYGGSIMVTLFGAGAITFDADLEAHSRAGKETLVTFASSLGRATGRPHDHAPAGQQ
ncbi:phosphatidylserine decarboxylase-domain-containing protein [Scenedesmus sp. NREL 46B-D3]|nr:phosphatidylserine decarboxylase-domain-containing protein [Scenedesmus sp. NREL 46B-D3]